MGSPHPSADAHGVDPARHNQESFNVLPAAQVGKKLNEKTPSASPGPLVPPGAAKKSKTSKRQFLKPKACQKQPKTPTTPKTGECNAFVVSTAVRSSTPPITEPTMGIARTESAPVLPNLLVQPAVVKRHSGPV